jgi:hypothetical protein
VAEKHKVPSTARDGKNDTLIVFLVAYDLRTGDIRWNRNTPWVSNVHRYLHFIPILLTACTTVSLCAGAGTRLCPKRLTHESEVAADEGEFHHAAKILGRLLEAREDAAAFLDPTDETFDDIAASISLAVEFDLACVTVLVLLGWDNRLNPKVQQKSVDPFGAESFVAGQLNRPSDGFPVVIDDFLVGSGQQRFKGRRLVVLSGREMKVKRMAVLVAQYVNFGRKPSARAA